MSTSTLVQEQLLATKFFVPLASGALISRGRLITLLDESLMYPLTLVSAAAGFGKTTLLATWTRSLLSNHPLVAWVSLDEEDNTPWLFWTSVLSALDKCHPERFTRLLMQLQSLQVLPLKHVLTELINLLTEQEEQFVIILDDYQVITEHQVHTTLDYLLEHIPSQLHIILITREYPPLHLSRLKARGQVLEVQTEQLRCTVEETKVFFQEVMDIQLPDQTIQDVTARTEGWLVGLQLLSLSLREHAGPANLLEELSGDHRYILDYLTEVVLQRQPQEVQTFLLFTSILGRFTASLCDAVTEQTDSQKMLGRLEQANLFVVPLDSKCQWYRYHPLFAEALHYHLEQIHPDLVSQLHYRASLWYAEHHQTTEAVLHAFRAREWQWAADLIERMLLPLITFTWRASQHALVTLWQWLGQLPAEVMRSRPRLYLACIRLLFEVASFPMLRVWLDAIETTVTTFLKTQMDGDISYPSPCWEAQQDLLGEVMAWRALLQSSEEHGEETFPLCQQAQALLSAENIIGHMRIIGSQFAAFYTSCTNDATASVQSGLQIVSLAQSLGQTILAILYMGSTALHMIGTGQLHEAQRLTQQAILLGRQPGEAPLLQVGYPSFFQADILREWNDLDRALELVKEGLSLCTQMEAMVSLMVLFFGYAVQLRVCLSCGALDAARCALQQIECIRMTMNQPLFLYEYSHYTTVDQVRLWIACGELEHATRWAKELDLQEQHGTPFAHEREDVARVRVLLANKQPDLALQKLESALKRANTGQRRGHVIEIRILQALAYQMHQQERQALDALSEAVRLAELEGYIRSFVEEGAPMETLLYHLRKQDRKYGPTPYLDRLLAAFQQENVVRVQKAAHPKAQALSNPLSEREMQVLQLLAHGASNLDIAQDLVISVDTIKRHVSHIFSKLGIQNRVQAIKQAQMLSLLDKQEDPQVQVLSDPLSEREMQVLQLLACGASNLEIAQDLVISVDTIKRHVSHIFSKLDVQNRVQAIKQAQMLGLLSEEH